MAITNPYTCPRCGTSVQPGQLRCFQCGTTLAASQTGPSSPATGQGQQQPGGQYPYPSAPTSPPPPPARSRRRSPLLIGFGILMAITLAIGAVTSIPYLTDAKFVAGVKTHVAATATSEAAVAFSQATAGAAASSSKATVGAANATAQAATSQTQVALTPVPRVGSTVEVAGWVITLTQVEQNDEQQFYKPSGKFWLLYIEANNGKNESRSLKESIDFNLLDDRGATYDELSKDHGGLLGVEGHGQLNELITPRGHTNPVLVFDVASDATPKELVVKDNALLSSGEAHFDLSKK